MREEIASIVADIATDKTTPITEHTSIIDELGFDSVNVVELISRLEDRFQISLHDEDLDLANFADVASMEALIAKYTASR